MIWLSIVSLVAGGLLARHFKIIVLVPATLAIVAIAIALGELRATDFWSITLIVVIPSVGIQIGYFFGILIQYGLSALLVRGSSPSSEQRTGRPSWISRTPISR